MDPLSVTASVVGLVGAAAQMTTALYSMGSAIKDAPRLTGAAVSELNDISHVLLQLQQYIDGKTQASLSRLSLITVEHITASLTGCVITYSELDAVLKSLHAGSEMKAWDRAMWLIKKDDVNSIIGRLQNHKSSFSLMLNIIQCSSMGEAERSMDDLCDKVSQLLRSNQELSMRLRNIEDGYTIRKTNTAAPTIVAGAAVSEDSASSTGAASVDEHVTSGDPGRLSSEGTVPRQSAFEELLHRSRVYRHAERRHSQSSLVDDGRSTLAISICSSLTLGEVSQISVFALPVYATELSNPEFYKFGRAMTVASVPGDSRVGGSALNPPMPSQSQPHVQDRDKRTLTTWYREFRKKPARPPTGPSSSDSSSGPPIFGVALTTSIRYANVAISLFDDDGNPYIYGYVPIVIAKCGVFLKEKATESEGIFEISGSPKNIKELITMFDSPPRYGKGIGWVESNYSVYDAGNVILRYLLTLPEPVIPLAFYHSFREPIQRISPEMAESFSQDDVNTLIRTYQELVTTLPPLSRQLLLYLQDCIAVFASKSEINKMTTAKLATIFQPGILAHPDHKSIPSEYRLDQDVLTFLIEYQDNFIIGMVDANSAPVALPTEPIASILRARQQS